MKDKTPEQVFRERANTFNSLRFQWEIGEMVAGSARPGRSGDLTGDLEMLREKGIRLIVNLTCTELLIPAEYTEVFQVLHVPIDDGHPPDLEQMHTIIRRIREAVSQDRRILVHCRGGIGRTATVLVPLLMELENLTLEKALKRVRASGRFTQTLKQKEFLEAWARSCQNH